MNKQFALRVAMLLSALESWSFSSKTDMPDYLLENLCEIVSELEKEILK